MITATYRTSLAGNVQAWIPLPCAGGALSPLLLAELLLPDKHWEARFVQLHALVERFSHSKYTQCLSLLSALEKPERKEALHLRVPLLVAQTTRVH